MTTSEIPNLSTNDSLVFTSIFDPESAPTPSLITIDASLPAYPHITSHSTLTQLRSQELLAIRAIESLGDVTTALSTLSSILSSYPLYASAYNNRAQVLRLSHTTVCPS